MPYTFKEGRENKCQVAKAVMDKEPANNYAEPMNRESRRPDRENTSRTTHKFSRSKETKEGNSKNEEKPQEKHPASEQSH